MRLFWKICLPVFALVPIFFFIVREFNEAFYYRSFENNKTFSGAVDLGLYAGRWYQVMEATEQGPNFMQKLFAFFENAEDVCYNTTIDYSIGNSEILLRNVCFVGADIRHRVEITGIATPINRENTKFKVRFSPWYMKFVSFDYWIVDVDPTYNMAVISSPSSKGVTIISRTISPDIQLLSRALSIAKNLGYDLSKTVRSPQIQ